MGDVKTGTIVGYGGADGAITFLTVEGTGGAINLTEGMTLAQRRQLWAGRASLVGSEVRYLGTGVLNVGARARSSADVNGHFQVRGSTPAESNEIDWTPLRTATFPAAVIDERADDRGDVYVFVNGLASYEPFDAACARLESLPAGTPIAAEPEPTIADLEALTKPRSLRQWWTRLVEQWRETQRLNNDIAYFRSVGHPSPMSAAASLRYLDEHYLADFRDFASKRRHGGIMLSESKQVYITKHLHPNNSVELTTEERAHLTRVIEDMETADALTPDALTLEEREFAEQTRELKVWAKSRPLTPAEKRQFQVLRTRR